MMRILAFLAALAPALAGAVQLTLDLTGPGLYPAGTTFQSVRLYSVRAGSNVAMEVRGFRPLILTREFLDSDSFQVDLPASPDGQVYRLWVNGESTDFVVAATPPDPTTLSAILQAQASRQPTGPVLISQTPPPRPSSGDIAFDPTGLAPGPYAPGLNIRQGGGWHQIQGGGGGTGLNAGQVDGRIKAFARSVGGREIALGDTDFAETVQDSIDGDRFSFNAQTGTLTCQTHGREDCGFTIPSTEERTEAELRTEILAAVQVDAPLERRTSGTGATQQVHIGASNLGDRIGHAERSVAALRRTRSIGSYTWTQAASDAGTQATGVALPTTPHAQLFEVHKRGEAAVQCTIVLGEIREKAAVTTPGTLDDTNSLTCTYGGVTFRYAHDNGSGLFVSADSVGSYAQDYSIDELDLNNLARKSSTSPWPATRPADGGAWAPGRNTNLGLTGDAGSGTLTSSTGTGTTLPGATGTRAGLMTGADKTKLDRYPSECPDGQIPKGAGTGQPFTCQTDSTATGSEAQNAAIDARIKLPAQEGNTADRFARTALPADVAYGPHFQLTPQEDAALSIFTGTEGWVASTSIQVSMDQQATKPTASDAQGKVFVAEQIVGPRQTNAWVVVRVPVAAYPVVDDDRARLRLWETSRTVGAPEADAWELLVTTAAYRYYVEQFADFPSGARYRVEEHDDVELIPNRIDLAEWRRDIVGHLGQTFAQQSPGVSPNPTSTSQLIATATALSPTLDLDDAAAQHGEFHISLELEMTQAHSTVSFTLNQPSPGDEDRQRTLSVIVYASDLRDEGDFTTSNLEGLVLFEVPVYAAATRQGRYWLLLVHDSNNQVALYRHWTGEAGSSAMTISAEARITFVPSDTPSLGALGGLTQGEVDDRILPPARTGNTTAWSTAKAPGRNTDLSLGTRTGSAVPIRSSTGTGTQIPPATQSRAGVMSAADKVKLDRYPAQPASGGGGLSLTDKDAALPAASGSTTTVGHHTNRKVVTTNSSRVEISDWGDLTLTTDATAAAGMTIANNRFVFATAGKIWMEGIFEITQPATGGASRSYNDFRGELVRGASTTHPMKLWSSTCYTKTTAPGTADGSVGQGPRRQRCNFLWMYEVEANDQIGVEWYAHSQSNAATPQTAIDIAQGALSVRLAH